jgi:hypothetical protein
MEIDGVVQADRPDKAGGHILVIESGNLVFHALINYSRIQSPWPSLLAGTKMDVNPAFRQIAGLNGSENT